MKTIIYSRHIPTRNETENGLLRATVENRGGTVVAAFNDDRTITGRGKYAGWQKMIASLDQADQVVVGSAADLPGRTMADLLKILSVLNEHGSGLYLDREGINTDGGPAAILDLIASYRLAIFSEAIKRGISKARMAGKAIGRPPVPNNVRRQIQTALANGAGIRPTARKHKVSPATVVNVRRMIDAEHDRLAATYVENRRQDHHRNEPFSDLSSSSKRP